MTELLIVKSGDRYVRFKNSTALVVDLEKASVFPLDQIDTLQEKIRQFGLETACIKKLILTEEDYTP